VVKVSGEGSLVKVSAEGSLARATHTGKQSLCTPFRSLFQVSFALSVFRAAQKKKSRRFFFKKNGCHELQTIQGSRGRPKP